MKRTENTEKINELEDIVLFQLSNIFFLTNGGVNVIKKALPEAERKTKESICAFKNKYFEGNVNPYNSVMYCIFLYCLARECYKECGVGEAPDKIYYLNKMLNAVDLYYEINLPLHWSCEHPVGAVMGRAVYGDRFMFTQGCTVGGNWSDGKLCYPTIGKNVTMLSNSKIVGDSRIGDNVVMSANSYVINTDVPNDSIVFGQGRDIAIVQRKKHHSQNAF